MTTHIDWQLSRAGCMGDEGSLYRDAASGLVEARFWPKMLYIAAMNAHAGYCPIPSRQRIVVAMSGGVDSSVVAGLLSREGHEVIGVTLQLYDHGKAVNRRGACCAGRDIHDAKRVAEHLAIPHYVLDYEERFRRAVIDDFADSYLRGETPIPCIRCNQKIKFGELLQLTRELGADSLATGHYVRKLATPDGPELHQAADLTRDQSYFLFATTREEASALQFPLGGLPKHRVREIARELDLPVAEKPDSQDICFVPDGDYAGVVKKVRPEATAPGDIVDERGEVLGTHSGVIHFTIGQRKGLGLRGNGEPLFVKQLDAPNHRVVVGPRDAISSRSMTLDAVNWLGSPDVESFSCSVKVRSTRPPVPAQVELRGEDSALVTLTGDGEVIAPGQACVFYESGGTRMLGGGWIARPSNKEP